MSITSAVAAIALLAILVFIHELGHFVAAKATGVSVRVFSIGFGARLFGFRIGETDYRVSALPFGGYVLMAGADPFGYADDDDPLADTRTSFLSRPVWQRLVVLAAGPVFNLLLPVVVFTALLMAGEPQRAPVVGTVSRDGQAAAAGLLPGDEILRVAGQHTGTMDEVFVALSAHGAGSVPVVVRRGGAEVDLQLELINGEDGELSPVGFSELLLDTAVGVADPASPAGLAGLRSGDLVRAVGGQPTPSWAAVSAALAASGASVEVEVEREGERLTRTLSRSADWRPLAMGVPVTAPLGWGLEHGSLYIGSVSDSFTKDSSDVLAGCRPKATAPPSPAFKAGLKPGDRLLRVNGQPIHEWSDLLRAVRATMVGEGVEATATPAELAVLRDGVVTMLTVQPEVILDTDQLGQYYARPILGVTPGGAWLDGPTVRVYYPFPEALQRAVRETVGLGGFILSHLGKLVTGEVAVQKSLGGPVEMFRQAGQAAERGLFDWARLLGILSVSLGIVNFMPLPVLDGGQILFHAVEGVRGRPLSVAIRERIQQIGLLMLVLLMLSVLVFDIQRIFEG